MNEKPKDDYAIGYGRPPKNQWAKGTSGNRRGRPKSVKNRTTLLQELFNQKISIRVNGTPKKVPWIEAMYLQCADRALRGDVKAAAFLFSEAKAQGVNFEPPWGTSKDIDKMTTQEKMDEYLRRVRWRPK